ncbi:MAG: hypothetical protein RLY86_1888 [Pseudomonadota bacterium]
MAGKRIGGGFFGYNFNLLLIRDWADSRLPAAVAGLEPGHLRIPGGTIADYWDWNRGAIIAGSPADYRLREIPYSEEQRGITGATLDAIAPAFRASGSEAIFVMNVLTSSLRSELDRIQQSVDAGIRITRVEIGNEQYFSLPNDTLRFPRPADYATLARTWAEAIRGRFPEVEIAVIGWIDMDRARAGNATRELNWNQALIDSGVLSVVDAIAFHPYIEPRETRSTLLRTPAEAAAEIAYHFDFSRAQLDQAVLRDLPPDLRFWITEYSTAEFNGTPVVGGTWVQALSNLGRALIYADDGRVDALTLHVLFGSTQWQSLVSPAFPVAIDQGRGGTSVPAEAFALTANGYAATLMGRMLGPEGGLFWGFDPTPGAAGDPTVGGRLIRADGSSAILVVNGSAEPVRLNSPVAGLGRAEMLTITDGNPWNSIYRPDQISGATVTVGNTAALDLPAFSAALLELPALRLGAGDDVVRDLIGDDAIDGGAGRDIVFFAGPGRDYTVSIIAGTVTVRRLEAVDTVRDVEILVFTDAIRLVDRPVMTGPLFDAAFYLDQYPDVARAVTAGWIATAWDHFTAFGQGEGRAPNALFDAAFYLERNPDVAGAVQTGALRSAVEHFLRFGAQEGRSPGPLFDSARYLDANPDVAAAGMGALAHFLQFGHAEGRTASPADLGWLFQ